MNKKSNHSDRIDISLQCQSTFTPGVRGVCPIEMSNKCNTFATDMPPYGLPDMPPYGLPNDLCGCKDPNFETIPPEYIPDFCGFDGLHLICKADSNGYFGCQGCSDGECPDFAPLCDGRYGCSCGTNGPLGVFQAWDVNTCSGNSTTDMFVCGVTGSQCIHGSVNPFCLDDSFMPKIGDEKSTCKVIKTCV